MSISTANINSLWGSLIVEELVRNGADYFCVSPGSRSAPLTMAVAAHAKARTRVHFDERGAAFHALGYARAAGKPAVLVCTSGTAVANYLPAIIEASADLVPLIVLTADRPPELHGVGANQTIEQEGIYRSFVRWSSNLPSPDRSISPETPLSAIDNACHYATRIPAGPVHVNCMFREPLAPIGTGEDFTSYLSTIQGWLNSTEPFATHESSAHTIDEESVASTLQKLSKAKAGIVILGHLPDAADREAALGLVDRLRWPVFADITSGTRLGPQRPNAAPFFNLALTSEKFNQANRPDTVLHIGGRVSSKRLMQWLESCEKLEFVQIINHPFRIDPIRRVTHRVETDVALFCRELTAQLPSARLSGYGETWSRRSQRIADLLTMSLGHLDRISEPGIARVLSSEISTHAGLFLASSMPIRDMDVFAATDGSRVPVAANRGASGIDGSVASASGYAVGLNKPVTLLIGDLALLHDLNSLALLHNAARPVIVVVINNNGGGIFDHLPISQFGDSFEKFFITPHGLKFEHAAKQFGLEYHRVATISDLRSTYQSAQTADRSCVIEVPVSRQENMRIHNWILQQIGDEVRSD